jgi:hypothetical protein
MNWRRWIGVIVILAIALIAAWIYVPWRLPEERAIAERLQSAPALTIKAYFRADESNPERVSGDRAALARSFRIAKKVGNYTVGSSIAVGVCDSDEVAHVLFYLYPWTDIRYDGALYRIDSGFWTELLRAAPTTKRWLHERMPDNFDENGDLLVRPHPRRPEGAR